MKAVSKEGPKAVKEKDRKALAIVLVAILLVLVVITLLPARPSEEAVPAPASEYVPYVLENETLVMTFDPLTGTARISGVGELNQKDLSTLLTMNSVLVTDVENIILCDGITEISYNAINGFDFLKTLKVAPTVGKIRNGAVRNCPELSYVFLPSGVWKIARDFLYGSKHCYVISDGWVERLIKDSNAENASVIENIGSWEELVKAVEEKPLLRRAFSSDQLATNDPEAGFDPMTVHGGFLQFGPYCELEKGNYIIRHMGKGFSALSPSNAYTSINGYTGELKMTKRRVVSNDTISYELYLSEDAEGVEFLINNTTSTAIEVHEVQILERVKPPEILKEWW